MISVQDDFRLFIKQEGYSATRVRLAVFEALVGQEPLSMGELVGRVSGVDRASVYRTIDLFERLNVVQRLNTGWKYKLELTDKFSEHHHHLTCTECGRTVSLSERELEHSIDRLAREHGFTPSSHQIEIQGVCHVCSTIDKIR